MICLIKPQFEAGRENVGKRGVVRDSRVHEDVIGKVLSYSEDSGFTPAGLTFSPVKGPEGNIEYLLHLVKGEAAEDILRDADLIRKTVNEAVEELGL